MSAKNPERQAGSPRKSAALWGSPCTCREALYPTPNSALCSQRRIFSWCSRLLRGREHIKELGYIQKTKVKLPRPQARIWEVRRTAGTTWGNSNGRHLKIGLIYKYDWKNPISPSAGENQCSNRISYAGHRICAPAFPLRGYQKWRVEIFHT